MNKLANKGVGSKNLEKICFFKEGHANMPSIRRV